MPSFMWKEDKKEQQLKNATNQVEKFFEEIKNDNKTKKMGNGINLVYRKDQHRFARDVMTAIRDNQVLLIQAGVGIGKSMGYLIPIFETIQEVDTFNSVVISTSNIALQQQLLTDIHFISELLGLEIKATIAKGINNYVCLRKLEDLISNAEEMDKKTLQMLRKEIETKQTIDRNELLEVSDEIWKQIQLKNRGACSRCAYSRHCLYRNISKEATNADVIITNHGNFVRAVMDNKDYINDADMFIFDEAHKLESAIRGINQGALNLSMITANINYYINNGILTSTSSINNASELIKTISYLFCDARKKTKDYYEDNTKEDGRIIKITDCDKIPFDINKTRQFTRKIIPRMERLISDIKRTNGFKNEYKLNSLKEYLEIFKDIDQNNNSENIYWGDYYCYNKLQIGYVAKSNLDITEDVFGRDIPIVCTSGTLLDANGSYNYFKKGLSFEEIQFKNQPVVDGRVYKSPYDYDNNSLFYYDTKVANPNDYQQYVSDLALKVSELIHATNGRCLVLFTAKSTMHTVYNLINKDEFDFKLLLQGTMSDSQVCKKFESDVKSCLFATGSFWEGIDIAGKSLCNVIITRLPFEHVDAINANKASQFNSRESFNMVYLNNMAQKMAQGTGRLIRSKNDKGIICCLDSRCEAYLNIIKNCTPYCNFTDNLQDVYDFSKKYITNRDGKRKVKEISLKDE